jgi:hypothetical protein
MERFEDGKFQPSRHGTARERIFAMVSRQEEGEKSAVASGCQSPAKEELGTGTWKLEAGS